MGHANGRYLILTESISKGGLRSASFIKFLPTISLIKRCRKVLTNQTALDRARKIVTIEKIELSFKEYGVNRHQRKLDGKYKDTLMMELFLT